MPGTFFSLPIAKEKQQIKIHQTQTKIQAFRGSQCWWSKNRWLPMNRFHRGEKSQATQNQSQDYRSPGCRFVGCYQRCKYQWLYPQGDNQKWIGIWSEPGFIKNESVTISHVLHLCVNSEIKYIYIYMYIIISIIMNQNPVAGENQAPLSTYGDFKIWPALFYIYIYIYINTYK